MNTNHDVGNPKHIATNSKLIFLTFCNDIFYNLASFLVYIKMIFQEGKYSAKRRPSYILSVISISLVLFILGLLGLVILHAQRLSEYVKEKIELSVIVNDNVKEVDVLRLQKLFDATEYVKTTQYVTKEEAAKELTKELGEDFIGFLGYNPLLPSIDVHVKAAYANSDSISWIKKEILKNKEVKEIYYEKTLIDKINDNIKTISVILLFFSVVLFLTAITLINNTIRLALYSKRFIIKSMQLVGATQSFIRKPFLIKGVLHGLYSGVIAIALLLSVLFISEHEIPEIILLQNFEHFTILFIFILLVGALISWWSTFIAVKKYLRMKLEDLY